VPELRFEGISDGLFSFAKLGSGFYADSLPCACSGGIAYFGVMLGEGEFYVVVCEGRFRGLVGRYQSDENGSRHGMSFPGRELVSFLPRYLRPATNA